MPSSRGRVGATPVTTYEVQPASLAPSSPTSPPKEVRFAPLPPKPSPLATSHSNVPSRRLTPTEAWSLYHFECHASGCTTCYNPYKVLYRQRGRLCSAGQSLANDVVLHVRHADGEIYAVPRANEAYRLVRVELAPGYDQVRGLLKSVDRLHHDRSRTSTRTVPIINYDAPSTRVRSPSPSQRRPLYQNQNLSRTSVIVEPATSERGSSRRESDSQRRASHRRSHHPSKRYVPVVVQDDNWSLDGNDDRAPVSYTLGPGVAPVLRFVPKTEPAGPLPAQPRERRGMLYEADMARQRNEKAYRVEIHVPRHEDRRRAEYNRRSAFWP